MKWSKEIIRFQYLIPNNLLQTGDTASAKILAKEVVHSRKAVSKIYTAKANLKSVEMQMKGQAAQVRVAGSLSKSADVMKAMNQLIKVPEIQKTMQEMSKEMMKVCTSNFCNIHLYIGAIHKGRLIKGVGRWLHQKEIYLIR